MMGNLEDYEELLCASKKPAVFYVWFGWIGALVRIGYLGTVLIPKTGG